MCLYPTKIKNPYYLPNEKNGGKAPKCRDFRQLHISTNCGWCEECRKEIANQWRIRLYEEHMSNQREEFVTLTFSPQGIQELENEIFEKEYKGLKKGDLDVNILCAYAIRKFTERWRKKYKRAPRHWFVNELGHNSSERIHLHGIMWRRDFEGSKREFKDKIKKWWTWGTIFIGNFVNERSINYIVKYITKVDKLNEGFKQKIFTSKGLGLDYLTRRGYSENQWREQETNMKYRSYAGYEVTLPKYYKSKLYNEEQRRKWWVYKLDEQKCSINGIEFDLTRQDEEEYRKLFINTLIRSRETNKKSGFGDNFTGNRKYIVSERMKQTIWELKFYNEKCTSFVNRREVTTEIEYNKKKLGYSELEKNMLVNEVRLGKYIGNLTDNERKKNCEIEEARTQGVSVRILRLIKKGVINI